MNQDAVAAVLSRVAQRETVPLALLLAVLTAMVKPGEEPDLVRIEGDLGRKAKEFRNLRERLLQPLGQDAELDRLRAEAARFLGDGRLVEADRALAQAELRNLDGTVALDKMSKERLLAAAGGRAERGATAMLKLNAESYREAAQRFAEAAMIAGAAEPAQGRVYGWMQGDTLVRIGEDLSDPEGLRAAIDHFRTMLSKLDNFEDTVPWARTQERLAATLKILARFEGGTERLQQAAAILRTTLEDLTQRLDPMLWASLQGRLGRVLLLLGEAGDDPALLEESVEALAASLSVISRASMRAEWTSLRFEYGKALAALGLRSSGAGHFEASINAFHDVLVEWPRETNPLQWAEVQNRVGNALCGLAAYYREPVVLEEAIAAFDAALEERRRETLPKLWALSTTHRADAQMRLARRLKDATMAGLAAASVSGAIEALRSAGLPAEAAQMEPLLAEAGTLVASLRKT